MRCQRRLGGGDYWDAAVDVDDTPLAEREPVEQRGLNGASIRRKLAAPSSLYEYLCDAELRAVDAGDLQQRRGVKHLHIPSPPSTSRPAGHNGDIGRALFPALLRARDDGRLSDKGVSSTHSPLAALETSAPPLRGH